MVGLLLSGGGQSEVVNERAQGVTALFMASKNGHAETVEVLLEHGAEVDAKTTGKGSLTPLFIAAQQGHAAVVSLLLGAGADREMRAENGASPLDVAQHFGHGEVAAALASAP